jgi:hypothetical protein
MKKTLLAFLLLTTSALLSGCGTLLGKPMVADEDALKFVRDFDEAEKKAAQTTEKPQALVKWVQAANKKEACKIYIGYYDPKDDMTLDPKFKLYWDGECKDGYAYGLGREFAKGNMLDMESLAEYTGGQVKPTYYLDIDKLINKQMIGDVENNKAAIITVEKKGLDTAYETLLLIEKNGVVYGLSTTSAYETSSLFKQIGATGTAYRHTKYATSEDKYTTEVEKKPVGYTIVRYKNGAVKHVDARTLQEVVLPQSYLNAFQRNISEAESAIQEIKPSLQLAENKKAYYKSLICKDSVKVDFMPDSEYKMICTPDEYLTPFMPAIKETRAKYEKKKLEYLAAEQQQQQLELQRQAQVAQAKAISDQQTSLQLQQLNQNLFNNNMQMLNKIQNSNNSFIQPIPSYAPSKPINCYQIGNITQCR